MIISKRINYTDSSNKSLSIFQAYRYTLFLYAGQVFSECGWIYSNMRLFEEALTCLKQALSFMRRNSRRTASVLQNIGAVYNEMELYSEALAHHQQAASLYGKLIVAS